MCLFIVVRAESPCIESESVSINEVVASVIVAEPLTEESFNRWVIGVAVVSIMGIPEASAMESGLTGRVNAPTERAQSNTMIVIYD